MPKEEIENFPNINIGMQGTADYAYFHFVVRIHYYNVLVSQEVAN